MRTPRAAERHAHGNRRREKVQSANTGNLVFTPAALVSYLSTIITLEPGDVIATGTPGVVGHAHRPPRYLPTEPS
nr:fumarylacetoacetate hydrolase family protein [Streptomyces hygroscopicus]